MDLFKAKDLISVIESLHALQIGFQVASVADDAAALSQEDYDSLDQILDDAVRLAAELGLTHAENKIKHSQAYFAGDKSRVTQATAENDIRNVRETIADSLQTEFEQFDNVTGKFLSVSHEEMQQRLKAGSRGQPNPKRKRRKAKNERESIGRL